MRGWVRRCIIQWGVRCWVEYIGFLASAPCPVLNSAAVTVSAVLPPGDTALVATSR